MKQVYFYIVVGVLGAVFDFITFAGMNYFGFTPVISQWTAAFIGATHNHIWHHFKVFNHNQGFKKTYFFSLNLAVMIIILSGPLLLAIDNLIGNLWLSKILLLPITGITGFIIRKYFIYITKQQ